MPSIWGQVRNVHSIDFTFLILPITPTLSSVLAHALSDEEAAQKRAKHAKAKGQKGAKSGAASEGGSSGEGLSGAFQVLKRSPKVRVKS